MNNSLRIALVSSALFCAAIGQAQPTIAPIGHNQWLTVASAQRNLVGSGGRFTGYVGTEQFATNSTTLATLGQSVRHAVRDGYDRPIRTGTTPPPAAVATTRINIWCVDAQFQFNDWIAYRGNTLRFGEINNETGAARDVRYEDVPPGDGGDFFRSTLRTGTGTGTIYTPTGLQALFRYQMAAWLIMQFDNRYAPTNNAVNLAIQQAIWAAMDTNLDGNNTNLSTYSAVTTNNNYWFRQAVAAVDALRTSGGATAFFERWAVVSAWATGTYPANVGDRVQTFLTEVPEPGFYGLLALGLSGLFVAMRRRGRQVA